MELSYPKLSHIRSISKNPNACPLHSFTQFSCNRTRWNMLKLWICWVRHGITMKNVHLGASWCIPHRRIAASARKLQPWSTAGATQGWCRKRCDHHQLWPGAALEFGDVMMFHSISFNSTWFWQVDGLWFWDVLECFGVAWWGFWCLDPRTLTH